MSLVSSGVDVVVLSGSARSASLDTTCVCSLSSEIDRGDKTDRALV